MWRHNKLAVVALVFMACCWIFVIGPFLSPTFSAVVFSSTAAVVVWRVVRRFNHRDDPRHLEQPRDHP
jgi:hypothetical protein